MKLIAYVDGSCEPNPGNGRYGVVLKTEKGELVRKAAGPAGYGSNNQAEYWAVIAAITMALAEGADELHVYSDSQLVAYQVSGKYSCHDAGLRELLQQVNEKRQRLRNFWISWIPREENWEADALAKSGAPAPILKPPDYAIPPEWKPAPPFSPEDQAVYDATLREMAASVTDAELMHWVADKGGELFLDDDGRLCCRNGTAVPWHVREEVRERQEALAALLREPVVAIIPSQQRQLTLLATEPERENDNAARAEEV